MDFSYYVCYKQNYKDMISWLRALPAADDYKRHVERLKEELGVSRLLAYDFYTPDTCACVILEFIESFGGGAKSLQSRVTAASSDNVSALGLLRSMVGARLKDPDEPGEPIDLGIEYGDIPLIRVWHSRVSDMPELQESHQPIRACPIKGTLGGWHVGVLAGSPSPREGEKGLEYLLARKAQAQRLEIGAGLPTLGQFYTRTDMASEPDPLTDWTLKEIGTCVRGLIKRSNIPSFSTFRQKLSSLHNQILRSDDNAIEEVVTEWARKLP
jgi:hypothetical protein